MMGQNAMKWIMHRRSPVRLFWKSLRHDFDWRGRASIAEFWNFNLFSIALLFGANYLGLEVDGLMGWERPVDTSNAFVYAASGLLLPSYLSVGIRRHHDRGRSGWNMLYLLIPYAGFIWFYFDALTPGTKFQNKFGIEPRYDYP